MPSEFDWVEADEVNQSDIASSREKRHLGGRTGPRWRLRLFLAVLIILGAAFSVWQLNQYLDNTAAAAEEELLGSHALVLRAAIQSDKEILNSILSGRTERWANVLLALVTQGGLVDRSHYGMQWQPSMPPSQVEATFTADLLQAEVYSDHVYSIDVGNSRTKLITLRQWTTYRRGQDRWLLSRPSASDWGPNIASQGRYLKLTYPERDADVGRRLAVDLEGVLAAACTNLIDLSCPDDLLLNVNLSTEAAVLLESGRPETILQGGNPVVLPAPSLIGIPQDETSYAALYRGYAGILVSTLVTQLNRWHCCQHAPIYQALIDAQLQQLGLKTWPLNGESSIGNFESAPTLEELDRAWNSELLLARPTEAREGQLAYAFVEFLLAEGYGNSIVSVQNALQESEDLEGWLKRVTLGNVTLEQLEMAWQDYALGF